MIIYQIPQSKGKNSLSSRQCLDFDYTFLPEFGTKPLYINIASSFWQMRN